MKKVFLLTMSVLLVVSLYARTGLYRLVIKADPSYNMTIGWVQFSGKDTKVFFDTRENYRKTGKLSHVASDVTYIRHRGLNNGFVTLSGLKPGTEYVFKVEDNNSSSRLFSFYTIENGDNVRLSVVAGGDSRTNRNIRRMADKMVSKLQPDFVIFDGDFTYSSSGKEWRRWLKDWQLTIRDGRLIPILVVPGNHERDEDVVKFFDLTDFPEGYYSVDIADNFLHFVSLNTQYQIPGQQTEWFINDLKKNQDAYWKIVAYHKPMRPHYSRKREGDLQYKYWAKPIYKYDVSLVLEGDTHTCKTTWPIVPDSTGYQGFTRDDAKGTVYVGEGCWGAPLRPADDIKPWTRDAESINQFKLLWIDKDKIEIRTVKYENEAHVKPVSYQNRFTLPEGIDLWNPKNGEVIIIKH